MNFLLFFLLSSVAISMTIITVEGTLPQGGCAPPAIRCGNGCCSPGSTCMLGICSPIGSTRIAKKCPKGHTIIGNICCPWSDHCGKVCCGGYPLAPWLHPKLICANPKLSLCCLPGKVDKNGICCSPRSSNCNGTCCGGSCVRGVECIETLAECKAQGFDSNCSRQKPCPIESRCVAGCCSQSI
jgi:hypothetical protein